MLRSRQREEAGLFDLYESAKLPVAGEAVLRIKKLYDVEIQARFLPASERAALRQEFAKPFFDDLEVWLKEHLGKISSKTPLAKTIKYALARLPKARPYLDHGFLELDNNAAERAVRLWPLDVKTISSWAQRRAVDPQQLPILSLRPPR